MFTDTHCHLYKEYYNDLECTIKDAKENGVSRYISDADNIESCYEMLELSKRFKDVYIALGIHPQNCFEDTKVVDELIKDNIEFGKIVAVGEIGLDYYYGKDDKEQQIKIFEEQLKIAEKYNLPVVVHSREATKDTMDILKKYKVKGVIHCFSGSLESAKEYIKMGYYIGIGGVMTFKNAKIGDVIKELPVNRLLLETDAPFLAPVPFRGHQNEPKYIKNIAEYAANLLNISVEELSKQTEKNIRDIFDF